MMLFKEDERVKVRAILKQVVKKLLQVGAEGVSALTPENVREIKTISRALNRVRLRRLSSRLTELADHISAVLNGDGDGDGQLAMLLTDCMQTAKFIKTQLTSAQTSPSSRDGAGEPLTPPSTDPIRAREPRDVLEEVFDCRWRDEDLTPIRDTVLVELGLESLSVSKTHRIDVRHYLDVDSGEFYINRKELLFPESEDALRPRPSSRPISLRHGLVYPGHPPRELKFIDAAESGESVDRDLFKKMIRWVRPTIENFRHVYVDLHENYFAPVSSPVLLAPHAFVTRGRNVYLMDDKGKMIRIDDTSGSQGVRFLRILERARIRVVYGRCFVDDGSVLTLAPLSAIVLSKSWHMLKF